MILQLGFVQQIAGFSLGFIARRNRPHVSITVDMVRKQRLHIQFTAKIVHYAFKLYDSLFPSDH